MKKEITYIHQDFARYESKKYSKTWETPIKPVSQNRPTIHGKTPTDMIS